MSRNTKLSLGLTTFLAVMLPASSVWGQTPPTPAPSPTPVPAPSPKPAATPAPKPIQGDGPFEIDEQIQKRFDQEIADLANLLILKGCHGTEQEIKAAEKKYAEDKTITDSYIKAKAAHDASLVQYNGIQGQKQRTQFIEDKAKEMRNELEAKAKKGVKACPVKEEPPSTPPPAPPPPEPPPSTDQKPIIMELLPDTMDDIHKKLDDRATGEISLLKVGQDLDMNEILNATGATTSRFRHSVDPIGLYGALTYYRAISNTDFMVGASASIALFEMRDRQNFASGTHWGTTINGYGALTAKLLYSPPALRNVGIYLEAGGALADQTISASFAPAFSSSALTPGVLVGGGVKIALPRLGEALGHPAFLNARFSEIFLADQTANPTGSAFHYKASSRLQTFGVGLEIGF